MKRAALICLLAMSFSLFLPPESQGQQTNARSFDDVQEMMCGPKCLYLVARLYGRPARLGEITRCCSTDPEKGTTVGDLIDCAARLGLTAEVVRTDLDALCVDKRKAILIVDANSHFVLFHDKRGRKVRFVDDERLREVDVEEFDRYWEGLAIMIAPVMSGDSNGLSGSRPLALLLIVAGSVASVLVIFRSRRKTKGNVRSASAGETTVQISHRPAR
jgi:ABC-type bacteriocin/lantibiotic exporter with double-glycine peptidase domain